MPIGKTSHDLTEMYQSPNVNVKAVSLVPPALRTAPRPADDPRVHMHTLRPDFSVTRPAALPRTELEAWRDLIVDHMFDRSRRTDRLDQPPGPFVRPDGTFSASWPESKFPLPLPTAEEQATELVYILEPPPVRGKFDVKRANELGVPNGPIRGRLVKGEDIEVDDPSAEGGKRIVRPADCLVGGHPGAVWHTGCRDEELS
jgi:ribonuclease Z